MKKKSRFLTGEWRHLAMFNHACDPTLLAPLIPPGTELDRHGDTTVVSLVGFRFLDTRVLGIPVPFYRDFDEVNLRFYVRRREPDGWRRGVVFIKEIVPKRLIAAIAREVYNENYVAHPMRRRIETNADGSLRVGGTLEYAWERPEGPAAMRCGSRGPRVKSPPAPKRNSSPNTIGATRCVATAARLSTRWSTRAGASTRWRRPR